jgi:hypothetical protein
MKVKCYALYQGEREVFAEYANISQKSFLVFETANVLKRIKYSNRIESEQTSNGVWYYKTSETSTSLSLSQLLAPGHARRTLHGDCQLSPRQGNRVRGSEDVGGTGADEDRRADQDDQRKHEDGQPQLQRDGVGEHHEGQRQQDHHQHERSLNSRTEVRTAEFSLNAT